ncbi:MAG: methyltransferase domain-containing protein [Microbacteriaceae bacterium]
MTGSAAEPSSSWDGFEYERVSALQRGVGATFVDSLELERPTSILDVGCGDGFLTEQIAQRSRADVLGVDASPAMIARAVERTTDRLRFAEADVVTMEFAARFDLVLSLNTLHWVLDLEAAFARLFAAGAPGSLLTCQLVAASDADSVEDVAARLSEEPDWRGYFDDGFHPYVHPTASQLRTFAGGAGYQSVTISSWDEVFTFPTAAHFERWCVAGMSVWTDRLPEDRRAGFVHDVTDRYARVSGSPCEFHFAQARLSAERIS